MGGKMISDIRSWIWSNDVQEFVNVESAPEKGCKKFKKLKSEDNVLATQRTGSARYRVPNLSTEHVLERWPQYDCNTKRSIKS